MKTAVRIAALAVVALLLVAASLAAGFLVGRSNPALIGPAAVQAQDPSLDLRIFWETWNYLKQEYYQRPLDQRALVRGAVKGMLQATGDVNTGYADPDQFRLSVEDLSGSFEGIGALVGVRDERLVIISPLQDSPAEKAGVRPGDLIKKIDGEDASKLTLLEATTRIRGKKGTTVRLTVERPRDASRLDEVARRTVLDALPALEAALAANDAERAREAARPVTEALRSLSGSTLEAEIAIVRDTIVEKRVEQRMLQDGIGYIKLSQFTGDSSGQFDEALAELLKGSPRALVLDLRRNGGGFVHEAVAIASQFLPGGTLVFVEERAGGERHEFRARTGGRALSLPLVVLVDKGTASAAEILAGALRDNGRGRLVGVVTFGKGTEQLWHTLADGSGVRITIARWLTPKGTWPQKDGLPPDDEVTDTDPAPPDLQLDRAIALLR